MGTCWGGNVSGSGIQNDIMVELELSVPLDRDPHLKRKTDVTNLLADSTKINNWAGNQRKLFKI
jgi:hypothetical protein